MFVFSKEIDMANDERTILDKPAPAQAPAEGADENTPPEDPSKPAPAEEPAEGADDTPAK